MMNSIVRLLKKKATIDHFLFSSSCSHDDKDIISRLFLDGHKNRKGFFIDIGAQHPFRFSSTLPLYRRGWRGINVEPTPRAINLFKIFRKRDINLNAGVSSETGMLPFYCFTDPALNSFSRDVSAHNQANIRYKLKKVITVETMPLAQLLDKYLPAGTTIDVLNIDTEEFDLGVLKSNDWNKYVPLFVTVETKIAPEYLVESEIYNYLSGRNYELAAQTSRISFFKLIESHNASKTP